MLCVISGLHGLVFQGTSLPTLHSPTLVRSLPSTGENSGISLHQTAADAHWQLGKVERHGQWFSRILDRVCDEVRPSSEEEWLDCLI
jgi:hypothetical protein